jgi:hypothetical protein
MKLDLDTLTLQSGGHRNFEDGACLLEAASYLAGEPWSASPKCVSDVLGSYGRSLNDRLGDEDRQKLKPFLPLLLNTAGDGQDDARRYMSADWAIRVGTPRWLDAAGMKKHAAALRALAPITDEATLRAARSAARAARDEAYSIRLKWRQSLRERLAVEFAKKGIKYPVAAEAAAAVAEAVAAVAAAVAEAAEAAEVAAAVAAEAAAEAAAAAAAADFYYRSPNYWAVRTAVRDAVLKKLREPGSEFAKVAALNTAEGITLLGRMIDPPAEKIAA